MYQKIVEEFKDKNGNFWKLSKDPAIQQAYQDVMVRTEFLDNQYSFDIPLKVRFHHYLSNSFSTPKCEGCEKPAVINRKYPLDHLNAPYSKYCSRACSDRCNPRNKKYDSKYDELMATPDWLIDQHHTQMKGIQRIKEETGISEPKLKRMLKKHGIEHRDYRLTATESLLRLKDKEWLYDQYISQMKPVTLLAIEMNLGTKIIREHLEAHDIPIRSSNETPIKRFVSKGEKEIADFLRSIGVDDIQTSVRNILSNGRELDIFLPDYNIAIEFNGVYFHSTTGRNASVITRDTHLEKTVECQSLGISLIQIWDSEWKFKRPIVESMLESRINTSNRLFARNTVIRDVPKREATQFLDDNHIQGRTTGIRHSIGLYSDDTLFSIMTFSKPRFSGKYDWELTRFCNKRGYSVVGGASKLLSAFRRQVKGSIVSYADRRYSSGNLYSALGFSLVSENPPSYKWVKESVSYSRYQCQKHKLNNLLSSFDPSLSERENMMNNGFHKIWDCGSITYTL